MKLAVPTAFGSIIFADHFKFNSRDEAVGGRRYVSGIMDRYTEWSDGFPSVGKSAEINAAAFLQFCSSSDKVENCWTDNAPELVAACRALGYRHHLSMENRPQFNGVAERNLRRILYGDLGRAPRLWAQPAILTSSHALLLCSSQFR